MSIHQAAPEWLRQKIAEFQINLNSMKTLKGQARSKAVIQREKQLKRMKQTMNSYQSSIQSGAFQGKIASHKAQYKEFQTQIDRLQKNMQANRSDLGTEEELFKHRTKSNTNTNINSRQYVVDVGNKGQEDSKEAARRIKVELGKMDDQVDLILSELDRQIQKLDKTYDELNDTEFTLKRAEYHLKYFAKQIYSDRLLICLIIVIAIAIIAIIGLAIAGKTPKAMKGTVA